MSAVLQDGKSANVPLKFNRSGEDIFQCTIRINARDGGELGCRGIALNAILHVYAAQKSNIHHEGDLHRGNRLIESARSKQSRIVNKTRYIHAGTQKANWVASHRSVTIRERQNVSRSVAAR